MLVSVIVPVRNESAHIRQTLACLQQQEFDAEAFEVLCIDGCSDDDTVAQMEDTQREFPQLRLFSNPKRLASACATSVFNNRAAAM